MLILLKCTKNVKKYTCVVFLKKVFDLLVI
ncbi:hypothetical protein CZ814_01164 [Photobacterium toruni]|uniref:Uncharacterized protein n=1 Tax=Photobacterium toruni TaxID=1935446 RepID=A0A1T4R2Q9_9GAMM|nr:hypothetical protein CZ814_01164 [Photobacterium toruni]